MRPCVRPRRPPLGPPTRLRARLRGGQGRPAAGARRARRLLPDCCAEPETVARSRCWNAAAKTALSDCFGDGGPGCERRGPSPSAALGLTCEDTQQIAPVDQDAAVSSAQSAASHRRCEARRGVIAGASGRPRLQPRAATTAARDGRGGAKRRAAAAPRRRSVASGDAAEAKRGGRLGRGLRPSRPPRRDSEGSLVLARGGLLGFRVLEMRKGMRSGLRTQREVDGSVKLIIFIFRGEFWRSLIVGIGRK